jgi:hypothetical protein
MAPEITSLLDDRLFETHGYYRVLNIIKTRPDYKHQSKQGYKKCLKWSHWDYTSYKPHFAPETSTILRLKSLLTFCP